MSDEYADIARRMRELDLQRDKPFATPLEPDFHAELNAKLQPKPVPAPDVVDEWYGGC